ncbi:casein kinase II, regulatory subunit, partial [Kipferlia bialata]
FVETERGLTLVKQRFYDSEYGLCPRSQCQGSAVLPIGLSPRLGQHTCKVYCPMCREVYHYQSSETDGT